MLCTCHEVITPATVAKGTHSAAINAPGVLESRAVVRPDVEEDEVAISTNSNEADDVGLLLHAAGLDSG